MPLSARTAVLVQHAEDSYSQTIFQSDETLELVFSAFITDREAWKCVTEVTHGSTIKLPEGEKYLATGRIDPENIAVIGKLPYVSNIQIARMMGTCTSIDEVKEEININQFLLDVPENSKSGEGVVIGIIDSGADFNHPNFKNEDGTSRIEYIWDQMYNYGPPNDSDISYGRVISTDEINRILQDDKETDKYSALEYDPGEGCHGTHVMDIAAGNNGVSPKSSIIFVDIDRNSENEGEPIASSVEVIDAMSFIFKKAGNRPCVINLSIGESSGPHDGTSDVELAITSLVSEKKDRSVVVAGGNFFDKNLHKSGIIKDNEPTVIQWQIPEDIEGCQDNDFEMLEIRYSGNDNFGTEIIIENEIYPAHLNTAETEIKDVDNEIIGHVSHTMDGNGDNQIYILRKIKRTLGIWNIKLTAQNVQDGKYHAYIEQPRNFGYSTLIDATTDCTLSSIATGKSSIVVACYRKDNDTRIISEFSSAGPTRTGVFKPELCSLGEDFWAASSKSNEEKRESGTSQSAPVITGIIARILSIACERNIELSTSDIQNILINSASLDDFIFENGETKIGKCGKPWHPRYGYGRITSNCLEDNLLH